MHQDTCDVRNCYRPSELTWYGYEICHKHWTKHCNKKKKWSLHKHFKIRKMSRLTAAIRKEKKRDKVLDAAFDNIIDQQESRDKHDYLYGNKRHCGNN